MDYNNNRHKQLVLRSQALRTQGKSLLIEDPKASFELSNYKISVDEQVFWTHRQNFFIIMESFINNILDFDEFENAFSLLYGKVRNEERMLQIDLEYIDKFQPSTRPYTFAPVMGSIYRQFEAVQDEYITEQEVKDYVKKKYLEFQKFKR